MRISCRKQTYNVYSVQIIVWRWCICLVRHDIWIQTFLGKQQIQIKVQNSGIWIYKSCNESNQEECSDNNCITCFRWCEKRGMYHGHHGDPSWALPINSATFRDVMLAQHMSLDSFNIRGGLIASTGPGSGLEKRQVEVLVFDSSHDITSLLTSQSLPQLSRSHRQIDHLLYSGLQPRNVDTHSYSRLLTVHSCKGGRSVHAKPSHMGQPALVCCRTVKMVFCQLLFSRLGGQTLRANCLKWCHIPGENYSFNGSYLPETRFDTKS